LKANGFDGTFDFLYLPVDSETNANKGYAFVNFESPGAAKEFKQRFDDGQVGVGKSGKAIKVTAATLQGYAANYAHYSNARVQRGPPETRPLFLPSSTANDGSKMNVKKNRRHRSLIDMAASVQKETESADGRFCHQCGGKVKPDFLFCILCGTKQLQ